MKRLALAAILVSAVAALCTACGSSVCSDYETQAKKCCSALPAGAAQDTCNKNIETVVSAADSDACQAGLDAANIACK